MRTVLALCLLALQGFCQVLSLMQAGHERKALSSQAGATFVMPAPLFRIIALEFDGLASDVLFLKGLVFRGSTYERTERPIVKDWEWKWLYAVMDTATGIDPYFVDPYYFAAAHFAWDGGLVRETNVLLAKGMAYRNWDWMLPFFVGFNNFYFLHDNAAASDYLMRSWRIPGAPAMLASLASKLAYKDHDTENAVMFLEELLKSTEDKKIRKEYAKRLRYMQGQLTLERALARFKKRHGKMPQTINDLLDRGVLPAVPPDPYGGTYYLDGEGRVKSTSEIQLLVPASK